LHKTGWGKWNQVALYFSLLKMRLDFSNPSNFHPENKFDVVFFDAFAPEKQPEMWTPAIFDKIYSVSSENAILTTYCAKGSVRRMLQAAGFFVERLPGPPGKREMLRAVKK
jgi:tRNA U34 5-methylaminomethyl-2-thiouridine-forming methyltransferase MnmC